MTSPSLKSHLCLPTETCEQILSYCDVQALGRASSVSLAFLELASPLLYKHVNITGYTQLRKLFYDESSGPASSAPHLDRYLSMDQTHTFTFIGTPDDLLQYDADGSLRPFRPRQSSTFPLRLDTVHAHFTRPGPGSDRGQGPTVATGGLLNLFDPEHAHLSSSLDPEPNDDPAEIDICSVPWTRLKTLSATKVIWSEHLFKMAFFDRLPARSLSVVFKRHTWEDYMMKGRVEYEMVNEYDAPPTEESIFSVTRPALKELVIECQFEGEIRHFKDELECEYDEFDVSDEERTRNATFIRWVTVE